MPAGTLATAHGGATHLGFSDSFTDFKGVFVILELFYRKSELCHLHGFWPM